MTVGGDGLRLILRCHYLAIRRELFRFVLFGYDFAVWRNRPRLFLDRLMGSRPVDQWEAADGGSRRNEIPKNNNTNGASGPANEESTPTKVHLRCLLDTGLQSRVALTHPAPLGWIFKPPAAKKLEAAGGAGAGRKAKRRPIAASAEIRARVTRGGVWKEVRCGRGCRGW